MENAILQGVATVAEEVAKKTVQSMHFDRTVICKILSQEENKYLVNYENLNFYVTAGDSNKKYVKNQQVYVLVPDGDFTNEKIIIGSYSSTKSETVEVRSPFDGLCLYWDIWEDFNKQEEYARQLSFNLPYISNNAPKYIGFEFSFTRIFGIDLPKNDFSIEIPLYKGQTELVTTFSISSADLLGNLENTTPRFVFQHLFKFDDFEPKVTYSFKVPSIIADGALAWAEQHFYLYSDMPEPGATLYAVNNPVSFRVETWTPEPGIMLYCEYMSEDGEFFRSRFPEGSGNTIKWYKYLPSQNGTYQEITDLDPKRMFYIESWPNPKNNYETYKVLINNAIGAILAIKNADEQDALTSTVLSEDNVRLECSDSGVYNFYSTNGTAIDMGEIQKTRTITASFTDGIPMTDDMVEDIKWICPTESTMIQKVDNETPHIFSFRLKNGYIPGLKEYNTIRCEVRMSNGEIRTGEITLRCGEINTVGSEYSLNLDFVGNKTALIWEAGAEVEVQVTLERRDGQALPEDLSFSWGWVEDDFTSLRPTRPDIEISYSGQKATLKMPNNLEAFDFTTPQDKVLKVRSNDFYIDNGLTAFLEAYLPIPVVNSEKRYRLVGPTYLVYGNDRTAIEAVSRAQYKLYKADSGEEVTSVTVRKLMPDFEVKSAGKLEDIKKLFKETTPDIKGTSLKPLGYCPDNPPVFTVAVEFVENGEKRCWQQPVFTIWNKYESDVLNKWNGVTSVGDDGILTPYLAAGEKFGNNEFSGVVVGKIAAINNTYEETGLYGQVSGANKFFLTNEGRFFVGDIAKKNFLGFNLPSSFSEKTGISKDILAGTLVLSGRYYQDFTTTFEGKTYASDLIIDYFDKEIFENVVGPAFSFSIKINNNIATNLSLMAGCVDSFYLNPIASLCQQGIGHTAAQLKIEARNVKNGSEVGNAVLHLGAINASSNTLSGSNGDVWVEGDGSGLTFYSQGFARLRSGQNYLEILADIENQNDENINLFSYYDYIHENNYSLLDLVNYGDKNFGVSVGGMCSNTYVNITGDKDTRKDLSRITFKDGSVKISNRVITPFHYRWTGGDNNWYAKGIDISASTGFFRERLSVLDFETKDAEQPSIRGHFNIIKEGGMLGGKWYFINPTVELDKGWLDPTVEGGSLYYGYRMEIKSNATESDSRIKHSITPFTETYDKLFDSLVPTTFIYNETARCGTSQRRHCGFIANQVEDSMNTLGLTGKDFAALDILGYIEGEDNSENPKCLKYDEFISLNTWQIQKLKARVTELEKEIKELKQL